MTGIHITFKTPW